jgi:antitoxin FitA
MQSACEHVLRMGMIQIRNVPPELHRKLKAKAAKLGLSLSEYMLREARRTADRVSPEELIERLRKRTPFRPKLSSVEILREERDRN